jgi:hypothetical protein
LHKMAPPWFCLKVRDDRRFITRLPTLHSTMFTLRYTLKQTICRQSNIHLQATACNYNEQWLVYWPSIQNVLGSNPTAAVFPCSCKRCVSKFQICGFGGAGNVDFVFRYVESKVILKIWWPHARQHGDGTLKVTVGRLSVYIDGFINKFYDNK